MQCPQCREKFGYSLAVYEAIRVYGQCVKCLRSNSSGPEFVEKMRKIRFAVPLGAGVQEAKKPKETKKFPAPNLKLF